jgi:hypothetical protein
MLQSPEKHMNHNATPPMHVHHLITSSTSSPDKYLYRYTIRCVHAWWISTLLFVDRGVPRMNNIISQRRVHFEKIHT